MEPGISVIIPTIPPRYNLLNRALESVYQQKLLPDAVIIETDHEGVGASVTRNKALFRVTTEWVACLDDDDEFLPWHLEQLMGVALREDADLVYSKWVGINTGLFRLIGQSWSDELANEIRRNNFIPVTTLLRTERVQEVGGFQELGMNGGATCEDWGLWLKLLDKGCKFFHHPVETWRWNGHASHTSGRPWK